VKCSSLEGELLAISVQDFYQHVKKQGESWALLCNYSLKKTLNIRRHIGISKQMRFAKCKALEAGQQDRTRANPSPDSEMSFKEEKPMDFSRFSMLSPGRLASMAEGSGLQGGQTLSANPLALGIVQGFPAGHVSRNRASYE